MIENVGLLYGLSVLTLFPWPLLTRVELDRVHSRCIRLFWLFRILTAGILVACYYLYLEKVSKETFRDVNIILFVVSLTFRQGWRYYFFHETHEYARTWSLLNQVGVTVTHMVATGLSYDTDYVVPFVLGVLIFPWDLYLVYLSYTDGSITSGTDTLHSPRQQDIEMGRIGPVQNKTVSSAYRVKRPGSKSRKASRSIAIARPKISRK